MLIKLHESKMHGNVDRWVSLAQIVQVCPADKLVRVDVIGMNSFMMDGEVENVAEYINGFATAEVSK